MSALTILIMRAVLVPGTSLWPGCQGGSQGLAGRGEKTSVVGEKPGILSQTVQPGGHWQGPQEGS